MRALLCGLTSVACLCLAAPAGATLYVTQFDQLNQSSILTDPLLAGDAVLSQTSVLTPGAALSQSLQFTVGADVAGLQGSVRWAVDPAAVVRLIGVNVNLLDSTNTVVATDTFQGLLAGFAISSLVTDQLTPGGTYTLQLTGNPVGISLANVEFALQPAPAVIDTTIAPSPPPTAHDHVFTPTTVLASATAAQPLLPGEALLIEAITPADGALAHDFTFVLGSGVDAVALAAAWIVTDGPLRLIGFNIDLLDATSTLVATDTFQGLLGVSAISRADISGLTPGQTYTLRVTGNAVGNGAYNLYLTAPGTLAPPDEVPEPATVALFGLGLLGFAATRVLTSRPRGPARR